MPLPPGARWVYEATSSDGEVERTVVEVLDETRTVMGIEAVVVHDVVDVDGDVIEDTYDWSAQDAHGNVWYLGEDTTAYEGGVAGTEGSWEAGVGGALPGVVMWGDPAAASGGHRQEYLAGEAEDMGEVIATSGTASTPAGDFDDVIVTRDWTPLEPEAIEEKTYAPRGGLGHRVEDRRRRAGRGRGARRLRARLLTGSGPWTNSPPSPRRSSPPPTASCGARWRRWPARANRARASCTRSGSGTGPR